MTATHASDERLATTVRREAALVVGHLHRLTGDFDVAEEAVQDAVATALVAWRDTGVPHRPGAWLTTVAKHRAIDVLRRDSRRSQIVTALATSLATDERYDEPEPSLGPPRHTSVAEAGERVGMLFACCHPSLAVEARLALTLRAVVGLTTSQVAAAFLVPEQTLAQRIVRAKRKIVANAIRLEIPDRDLAHRLDDVLTVVYLTYNAGFLDPAQTDASTTKPSATASAARATRAGQIDSLTSDAVWLAELVTTALPREPEAWGLLALLTLQNARARARFDSGGNVVLLPDQDRRAWDHPSIVRAERYLERAALWRRPGRFQLHAAIAACHANAPTWAETDWLQILTLYDVLRRHDPSPVVALNHAVALAEWSGPTAGLAALEALVEPLDGYHLLHATRAEMLRRLGDPEAARRADERALQLVVTPVERMLLEERLGHTPQS